MKRVLDCNEGFRRRVGKQFVFSDYTAEQIADIMLIKMTSPEASHPMPGFRLSKGCTRQKLGRLIQTRIPQTERQQRNGGLAMTLLQEARDHLDERLSLQCSDRDALMTITMRDFGAAADGVSAMACGPTKKPRF